MIDRLYYIIMYYDHDDVVMTCEYSMTLFALSLLIILPARMMGSSDTQIQVNVDVRVCKNTLCTATDSHRQFIVWQDNRIV